MWNFKVIEPGFPEEDPRETEFFRVRTPAEAVVREFIQNSLDAGKDGETIKVKISLTCAERKNIHHFLDNTLKEHLISCGFLDEHGYPENVPCLILEDFGTTGLDGPFTPDAGEGNFYNFWWRKGISQKGERKAGRWGLGKITFHIISKIRTFFGLTAREDRKTLLMGKALLKAHVFRNRRYHYFGYFSRNNSMPVEDNSIISSFRVSFGIDRDNTETGLSLVIPLPVDEINFNSLLRGVIQHYFYPILDGTLRVKIQEGDRQKELNDSSLFEMVSSINWDDTEWKEINIRKILEFVKGAREMPPVDLRVKSQDNPEIVRESFGDQLDVIKNSFRAGNPVRFKIPLRIRKNDGSETATSFTVLLKRFPEFKEPFECYIRSGILVSEIRTLGNRPVAGLLIADEAPICEFLGDCETPAHTNWNERTEGFKEKYPDAARNLRFIKRSMVQIVSILDEPPSERQIDFLKEIFSVPLSPEEREEMAEITRAPEIQQVERTLRTFSISRTQNGFSITLNEGITGLSFPFRAAVRMAYDTFRDNPFRSYEKFDFDVGSSSINIDADDCTVLKRELNELEIEITGWKFRLEVTGFDPNRDLVVDIKEFSA